MPLNASRAAFDHSKAPFFIHPVIGAMTEPRSLMNLLQNEVKTLKTAYLYDYLGLRMDLDCLNLALINLNTMG